MLRQVAAADRGDTEGGGRQLIAAMMGAGMIHGQSSS